MTGHIIPRLDHSATETAILVDFMETVIDSDRHRGRVLTAIDIILGYSRRLGKSGQVPGDFDIEVFNTVADEEETPIDHLMEEYEG